VRSVVRSTKVIWMVVLLMEMVFGGGVATGAEPKPSLAILPFLSERLGDPARGAVCPVCGEPARRGHLPPGSPGAVTQILYEKTADLQRFLILPMERVEEVLGPAERENLEGKPVPYSAHLGKELGVEFICVGFLYRFEERIGSSWGVEQPASVAFHIHLVRVRDGKMVWTGKFDETQIPLSDDLLKLGAFLRRKASWLTAKELAAVGIQETLKNMPSNEELLE
jgi:hypothetical protein